MNYRSIKISFRIHENPPRKSSRKTGQSVSNMRIYLFTNSKYWFKDTVVIWKSFQWARKPIEFRTEKIVPLKWTMFCWYRSSISLVMFFQYWSSEGIDQYKVLYISYYSQLYFVYWQNMNSWSLMIIHAGKCNN